MKYASEILGLMRPYPGREFKMAQLMCEVIGGGNASPEKVEAARRGIRRVLDDLVSLGCVDRRGGNTRSVTYSWREKPQHPVSERSCYGRQILGQ